MEQLNVKKEMVNNMSNEPKSEEVMEQMETTVENTTTMPENLKENNMNEIEKLKADLQAKRKELLNVGEKPANIRKAMEVNVRKAERALKECLAKQILPTLPVEFWKQEQSNSKETVYSKEVQDVIIGVSVYNMEVTKVSIEKGKDLLIDKWLEKDPLYVVPSKLFYDNEIELKDLNGNVIPKGTENVYVSLDNAKDFWKFRAYLSSNIDAFIEDGQSTTVPNVQVREFTALKDYAQYTGVNNILSRAMNGIEKAGIAALATQNEFFKKVFEVSKRRNMPISTVTKYYNTGKTFPSKIWNDAMLGNTPEKFNYDLTCGDTILDVLAEKGFSESVQKERYMIDALMNLCCHIEPSTKEKVGFDMALAALQALNSMEVEFINKTKEDKLNTIYSMLFEEYTSIRDKECQAA